MSDFGLPRLIAGGPHVLRGHQQQPVLIGSSRIDKHSRRHGVWSRARGNLVQVYGDGHAVGMHPHVTHPEHGAGRKLALDSQIPLRRLRIAEMRIVGLLQAASAEHHGPGSGSGLRELVQRRLQHAVSVVNRVHIGEQIGCGVARIVEGHWAQCGYGENTEARTNDGFVVVKWPVCQADARIEIALVQLSQTLCHMRLAGRRDVGTRERRVSIGQRTGVERFKKSGVDGLQGWIIRYRRRFQELIRNQHAVDLGIETPQVALTFNKRRKQFPAQPEIESQMAVHLPFVLTVDAPLRRQCVDLRAGDREKRLLRQAQQEISEKVVCERAGAESEIAIVVRGLEEHQRVVTHPARIHAEPEGVLAHYVGEIVRDLGCV